MALGPLPITVHGELPPSQLSGRRSHGFVSTIDILDESWKCKQNLGTFKNKQHVKCLVFNWHEWYMDSLSIHTIYYNTRHGKCILFGVILYSMSVKRKQYITVQAWSNPNLGNYGHIIFLHANSMILLINIHFYWALWLMESWSGLFGIYPYW